MPPPLRTNIPAPPRHYSDLQDPPSPSGKLADRIFRLRQKCIENFGRDAFDDAYRYIRCHNEVCYVAVNYCELSINFIIYILFLQEDGPSNYQEDSEATKMSRIRSIVGENKAKYIPLIDQLIFMEDTNAN